VSVDLNHADTVVSGVGFGGHDGSTLL
jgi:hypothetical protein